jgi:hypothetical protein
MKKEKEKKKRTKSSKAIKFEMNTFSSSSSYFHSLQNQISYKLIIINNFVN